MHGGYGASVPKYDAILMSLLEVAMALGHLHNLQLVHGGAGGKGGREWGGEEREGGKGGEGAEGGGGGGRRRDASGLME